MDNHYHLILETPRGNMVQVMQGINGGYIGYFNRKNERAWHLFQGRHKGILVDKDNYLVERKRFMALPNPGDVIKEIAKAFGTDEELLKEKGRKGSTARKAAIYFVQRYSGLGNEEIGKIFGGIHISAVSKASDRLKKEMADDKRLSKRIEKINSSFKS